MLDGLTIAAVLLAGGLIGATGIGGVLVVPILTQLAGLALPQAIAASALAYALPGAAALLWLWRSGDWQRRWSALLVGAVPAAALGGFAVHLVQPRWLLAGIALLAFASGARGLRAVPVAAAAEARPLSLPALIALGLGVGAGSALTGTGGPVLLVPLLLLAQQPLAATVAMAQAIQLPVALCAGAAHASAGALDLPLALGLGAVLLLGSLGGRAAALRLPVPLLHRLVSLLLLGVGLWYGWRAVLLF